MRAVRFDRYGGPEVLQVVEVPTPEPGGGEVLIRVVAAGTNPGEAGIRSGKLRHRYPARFPEGQGSDLAGRVSAVGPGVDAVAVGEAVVGLSDHRNAQADYAVLPWQRVVLKPDGLSWEVAATLYVAGTTAVALLQEADLRPGETVIMAGAAGGVGVFATQLAIAAGARVIALASEPNHAKLASWGAEPIAYGQGLERRLRSQLQGGPDALMDAHGGGYLDLGVALGVPPNRMVTLTDREQAARLGSAATGMASVRDPADQVRMLAQAAADGQIQIPIKAGFSLERVQDAYRSVERRSGLGKVVLDIATDTAPR